jgi:uncharacterized protein YndB with AHSA1/START domain
VTDAPLPDIIATIGIEAPIAHVWETLTSGATVPQWLGCIGYRRDVGVTFYMQQDMARRERGDTTGATNCTIKRLDPPHRFDFTWFVPGTPETLVEITLSPVGTDRTRVEMRHIGWDQFPAEMVKPFHDQLKSGWSSGVLPALKSAAERTP